MTGVNDAGMLLLFVEGHECIVEHDGDAVVEEGLAKDQKVQDHVHANFFKDG